MKIVLSLALMLPAMIGPAHGLNLFDIFSDSPASSIAPADRQLSQSTQALLSIKGMTQDAPIFIRIFKEESELEVWKLKNGRFELFRTYAICAWSGGLGPKVQQGDKQAPEGFYTISHGQLNPHSLYHLAFNIGFPNAYDRANNHTGSALMIHGNCKSAGCYAMTDDYIEEIYILGRDALAAGQTRFHVHAFPFRMTSWNMRTHRDSPWYPFWLKMKEGYDYFETTGLLPVVKVCNKQYQVNVQFAGGIDPAPEATCPMYTKVDPAQMPMDGIPQVQFAGLKKPDTGTQQSKPMPVIATASASMSASPVVTHATQTTPLQVQTTPAAQPQHFAAASMIATKPTQTLPVTSTFATSAVATSNGQQKPPVTYSASASAATTQPTNTWQAWQPATQSQQQTTQSTAVMQSTQQQATVADADAPTKYVDPDALQKPNRSAKSGKLPMAFENNGAGNTMSAATSPSVYNLGR